ncbi:unnamed protein product [Paramecium sonneborni]|uniref:Uncharacterized protein n=1 Tax=Paramecium sonneborni TaxID=65129 RepID=A0A8S1RVK3_9CILI|nr:unnamed protein product [Paramecium sonneborni]
MGLYSTIIKIIEQEWEGFYNIQLDSTQRHKIYDFFLTFVVVNYNLYYPITKYFSMKINMQIAILQQLALLDIKFLQSSLVSLSRISEGDFRNQLIKQQSLHLFIYKIQQQHQRVYLIQQIFKLHYTYQSRKKIYLVQKDDLKEFYKQILEDIDDYLNNMKIQQTTNSGRKQKLKPYLFELFLKDQKYRRLLQMMVKLKIIKYQERFFMSKNIIRQNQQSFDIYPCFILILQEKKIEVKLEEFSLRNEMRKKSLDQTSLIFKHQVRISFMDLQICKQKKKKFYQQIDVNNLFMDKVLKLIMIFLNN